MDAKRYSDSVLLREASALQEAQPGSRALTAFRSAAKVGNFVGAGYLDRAVAEDILLRSALLTGLPQLEAIGHIRRGLNAGERTPREPATRRQHEWTAP